MLFMSKYPRASRKAEAASLFVWPSRQRTSTCETLRRPGAKNNSKCSTSPCAFGFTKCSRRVSSAVDNFRLSQTSHEILGLLQGFQKQWDRFVEQMDKVGRNLRTAGTAFDELEGTRRRGVERELEKIETVRRNQVEDTPAAVAPGSVGAANVLPLALEG